MRVDGRDFVPFVLGMPRFAAALAESSCLAGTRLLDVLDDDNHAFFRLLNAGNALAYGGAGMPDWVQLDCATMPTAMIGFGLPRGHVPADLWAELAAGELASYDGLVPVAEFCASYTAEAGTVVGFSMFSLLRGLRLGVRSKALALQCMGAKKQIGITRTGGHERRAQEVFGALRILAERPAAHPNPDTIVYEIDAPAPDVLERIVRTGM